MGVVAWIVVGLLAGGLARIATGSEKQGCLGTMAVGLIGALIGGALASWAFDDDTDRFGHFGFTSIAIAFLGATLLLLVLRAIGYGASKRSVNPPR